MIYSYKFEMKRERRDAAECGIPSNKN